MKTIKKLGLVVAVSATFGVSAAAHAAPHTVELVRVYSGSANGSLCSDVTDPSVGPCYGQITGTRTGIYDDVNGTVRMDLGTTSIAFQITPLPTSGIFTHEHTDWLTGNSAYDASAYACVEGPFGSAVAATICGGYNWGQNFIEESTIDYSSIPGTRTIGGDDEVVLPQMQGADYASSTALFTGLGGELIMNSLDWDGGIGTEATSGFQLRFLVDVIPPVAPVINVDPRSVDYGDVIVGATRQETVIVSNVGNADLNVGLVGGTDGLAPPFSFGSDNCSMQLLPPRGSCTVVIDYQPGSAGSFSDSFNVPSNDAGAPNVTVDVSGNGVPRPTVGGTATGLEIESVRCAPLGQPVVISINGASDSWDCELEGLDVQPGDRVEMRIIGIVPELNGG